MGLSQCAGQHVQHDSGLSPCQGLTGSRYTLYQGERRHIPDTIIDSELLVRVYLGHPGWASYCEVIGKELQLLQVIGKAGGDYATAGLRYERQGCCDHLDECFTVNLRKVSKDASAIIVVAVLKPDFKIRSEEVHHFGGVSLHRTDPDGISELLCDFVPQTFHSPHVGALLLVAFHRHPEGGWHFEVVDKQYNVTIGMDEHISLQPELAKVTDRARRITPTIEFQTVKRSSCTPSPPACSKACTDVRSKEHDDELPYN